MLVLKQLFNFVKIVLFHCISLPRSDCYCQISKLNFTLQYLLVKCCCRVVGWVFPLYFFYHWLSVQRILPSGEWNADWPSSTANTHSKVIDTTSTELVKNLFWLNMQNNNCVILNYHRYLIEQCRKKLRQRSKFCHLLNLKEACCSSKKMNHFATKENIYFNLQHSNFLQLKYKKHHIFDLLSKVCLHCAENRCKLVGVKEQKIKILLSYNGAIFAIV
jgi:hypothetical protein